jgi:hypothetical protein
MAFGHGSAFSQEKKRKSALRLNTRAERKSDFSKKILRPARMASDSVFHIDHERHETHENGQTKRRLR